MKVLLVGGGGREAALAWKLAQSPVLTELWTTHDNPGFPEDSEVLGGRDIVESAMDGGIDLVVVGPEGPLADGVADRLLAVGVPCFGPLRAAAQLESSKSFAKAFMDRHSIPTAAWSAYDDPDTAAAAAMGPCVVKADGLAAGKGVIVCDDGAQARAAIRALMVDGGHERVVLEERLTGPEVSVLAVCDGHRVVPLLAARDHKRRFDGDRGPNTGGMGAVCPAPGVDAATLDTIRAQVLEPAIAGMAAEGTLFRGVLYAGMMLCPTGPKVIEFNVRFGDPECQVLMMMLDEDLLPVLYSAATGALSPRPLRFREGAACCVVVAADGYPEAPRTGGVLRGLPAPSRDLVCFVAGARAQGDGLVSSGGRVLGMTAHGTDLDEARRRAYAALASIEAEGCSWRTDIGA